MYQSLITREHRTAFVLLCDQSGSMSEEVIFRGESMTKSHAVARIMNMFIDELINRSRRAEGVRDYFDIAALGYSGNGVVSLLGDKDFTSVSDLTLRPVNINKYSILRTMPSGNQIAAMVTHREWIVPMAYGDTPMGAALDEAFRLLKKWCASARNRQSFPPMLINITDGEASDADEAYLCERAEKIKSLSTDDGNVLFINIHLAQTKDNYQMEVTFPSGLHEIPPHRYARLIYDMSSSMPSCYNAIIAAAKPGSNPPFRGMSFNCAIDELFALLTIGSLSVSKTA